VFSVSNGHLC